MKLSNLINLYSEFFHFFFISDIFSASPEKSRESPRKVISAFGVHKPKVQKCFFDVFDTNLSLIEETEKSLRKFMKAVKKPEGGGRSAEKNKGLSSYLFT